MAGIKDYFTTAANNDSAGLLFPEGMTRAAVNNSARQVQADIRNWYNSAEWLEILDGEGDGTVTYASATSFTVDGADVTATYHPGRRVKASGTATGTIYGTITASTFSTDTTVTVDWDSGSLSNESIQVWIGATSEDNTSFPELETLKLRSVDAGASAKPVLQLDRDSASPAAADRLGETQFRGKDSVGSNVVYTKLQGVIIDPTNGNESGRLNFYITYNGSLTTPLQLDGDSLTQRSVDSGATAGPNLILHRNSASPADDDIIGRLQFDGNDSGATQTTYAAIEGHIVDVTDTTEDGSLVFKLIGTGSEIEHMRLVPNDLLLNKTAADVGATAGWELSTDGGQNFITTDGAPPLNLNRLTDDGVLLSLKQAGTVEGSIAVSGTTVSYNTFTGGHAAQWADGEEPASDPPLGTLLSTVDQPYERRVAFVDGRQARISGKGRGVRRGPVATPENMPDVLDPADVPENARIEDRPKPQLCAVKITDRQADRRIYGVFGSVDRETGDINVFALGTAMVRVQGPIEGGDLIRSSATPGVAEAQPDDIVRSSTVGKVSRGDGETGERLVACVLYCG